jgi:hypothetical protein
MVFTKSALRRAGCNPVWYTDMTPGPGPEWLSKAVDALVEDAIDRCTVTVDGEETLNTAWLADEPIFRLTPFIEQMGRMTNGGRKEWWWEREWRHVGDFRIAGPGSIVAFLAPEVDHEQLSSELAEANATFRDARRPMLDPRWGLERMIAELAHVDPADVGPFPK